VTALTVNYEKFELMLKRRAKAYRLAVPVQ